MLTYENARRNLGNSSCWDLVLQLVVFASLQPGLGKCASHLCILIENWPREKHAQNDPWTKTMTLEYCIPSLDFLTLTEHFMMQKPRDFCMYKVTLCSLRWKNTHIFLVTLKLLTEWTKMGERYGRGKIPLKDGHEMNKSIYLFRHVPTHCIQGNLY